MTRLKKKTPIGTVMLCTPTGIIRRMTFHRSQGQAVVGKGDDATYNEAGALAYIKHQKMLWERADQFRDIPLSIEIGD